jgi:DNA-directed RNA polymerase specialized sigma24 family protein
MDEQTVPLTDAETEAAAFDDTQYALPEEEVIVSESIRQMQNGCFFAMVRRLTLDQRIAFSLVDMFGLSAAETARLTGITEGALKAQLFCPRCT